MTKVIDAAPRIRKSFEVNDAALDGCGDGLRAIGHLKFFEDVRDVRVDCAFSDFAGATNFFAAHSFGDGFQCRHFAFGQLRMPQTLSQQFGKAGGKNCLPA